MSSDNTCRAHPSSAWVRIPDGIKVRHRDYAYEGYVDGLTELVEGAQRNPDGKTQYRVNVGPGARQLVTEEHLSILLDHNSLVMMAREKEPYRRVITAHLRASLGEHRFLRVA